MIAESTILAALMPEPSLPSRLDAHILPIIRAANRLRQARDRLNPLVWRMIPGAVRGPIDAVFVAVETYERYIGRLIDEGLMPPTPE